MRIYFDSVSSFLANGTPYGENGFGYPPLAFLFVSIPCIFGVREFSEFYQSYRILCFAVDVLLFWLLSRACDRRSLLVYILSTTILGNLLYHRLDIALGFLLAGALVLHERGSVRFAGAVLGASIAFKVIPVLLVPGWVGWLVRKKLSGAASALGAVALGAGVPTAIGYFLWGEDAVLFMQGHAARGVQLESTWGTIEMVLMGFGLEGKIYWGAGSFNLSTRLESAFTTASHFLGIASAFWGGWLSLRVAPQHRSLIPIAAATLGACIAVSKVFSPQFLLFFLPTLALSWDGMSAMARRWTEVLAVGCCALTTWVYPYHEAEVVKLAEVATAPLVFRNLAFIALVILLQVVAWRGGANESALEQESGRAGM